MMTVIKNIANLAFFIAMILLALNVNATCTAPSGNVDLSPQIIIQRDLPVGQTLATGQLVTQITCNNTGGDGSWQVSPSTINSDYGASPIEGVRNTPVAGVGIKWTNLNSNTGTTQNWSTAAFNSYATGGRGIALNGVTTFTDTFELIKTGPIISDSFSSWILSYDYRTSSGQSTTPLNDIILNPRSIIVLACNVTRSIIPVSLGDNIQRSIFTGIGATSSDVPFNIPLDCDSGVRVNFQIDGTGSGQPGVLALNNDTDAAKGLGVQILYKGTPVPLGSRVFSSLVTSSGPIGVDFVARYYQTNENVTGGPANATATFTMTYQ